MAGATKIKVFYRSQALRTNKKTKQNRFRSLSNEACHQDRAKNCSLDPPGSVLKGSAALLCSSWALLGVSWLFLGASWARLRLSWAFLGRSVAPLGCILASRDDRGLHFGRFWDMPGWVVEDSGVCFACFLLRRAFRYTVLSLMQAPRFCNYLRFSCERQFGHLGRRLGHLGEQLGHLGQQLIFGAVWSSGALTSQQN